MTLHRVEHPIGPNNAPAIVKHCIRFGRRLRAHGIYNYAFPPFVSSDTGCAILAAGRVVMLDDTGSYRQCLRPFETAPGCAVGDRHALLAHRNRTHAMWLKLAGESRRRGWKLSARADLFVATQERKYAPHR